MSLLNELPNLNQSQRLAFIESFENDGRIEFINKLGKNRVFSQIISNLSLFDANDLADSLPEYNKKSLHFN